MPVSKVVVTGGAGFIGSAFIRAALAKGYKIVVIDKLTYAGDLLRLKEAKGRYVLYQADICNTAQIEAILSKERPQALINFAAETHVDRSITAAAIFIKTNIQGTQVLLDAARKYHLSRFIQISTDEVFGEIIKGKFREDSPLKPNSPYAASKAAADLLVKSYMRTYKFPAIIIRPCNNYGPWQYPEKFIPVVISQALLDKKVPVYAQGLNVRQWLYVEDTARAIEIVLKKGKIAEIYNLGSPYEEKNIILAQCILKLLGKPRSLIGFVADRPGHDFRYALNYCKIKKLGWKPETSLSQGLSKTVAWYRENFNWVKSKLRGKP
jgi:dTDP-glucose 4,6-dehydratase